MVDYKIYIIFLSIGIKPNSDFIKENFKEAINENNQIIVNNYLQVANYKNIFSAGDVTSINEEKTAQNSERQAKIIVKNLLFLQAGKN